MIEIDTVDQNLIKELQKDGRRSCTSLAKLLGISVSSVSRRIARLLSEDAIRITVITDPKKLGYGSMAIIALDTDMNKIDAVCQRLIEYPNVGLIAISFGRFDVLISVRFPTSDEMVHFVKNELSLIEGVQQAETFYVAELKQHGFGML